MDHKINVEEGTADGPSILFHIVRKPELISHIVTNWSQAFKEILASIAQSP